MMNRTAAIAFAIMIAALPLGAEGASTSVLNMPQESGGQRNDGQIYHAHGIVNNVDAETGHVTISHDPIPELHWSAMTIGFEVEDKSQLKDIRVGNSVDFDIRQEGPSYRIVKIAPIEK